MAKTRREYGSSSRTMLRALRDSGLLKVEALVAWLKGREIHVDRTLVSHWVAGSTHLPADLLPLLAEFTGRPDQVFGEYVRVVECEVVQIPSASAEDEDLTDLLLGASASLGRLHQVLCEARSPASPGGVTITADERAELSTRLDELIHLLADVRARLRGETS